MSPFSTCSRSMRMYLGVCGWPIFNVRHLLNADPVGILSMMPAFTSGMDTPPTGRHGSIASRSALGRSVCNRSACLVRSDNFEQPVHCCGRRLPPQGMGVDCCAFRGARYAASPAWVSCSMVCPRQNNVLGPFTLVRPRSVKRSSRFWARRLPNTGSVGTKHRPYAPRPYGAWMHD